MHAGAGIACWYVLYIIIRSTTPQTPLVARCSFCPTYQRYRTYHLYVLYLEYTPTLSSRRSSFGTMLTLPMLEGQPANQTLL
ncbi:hypothetical protein BZA05DRAFT_388718 [Tricharina praecox]|uniref:uncharacterized protein n=1 Tax=Tricharina praecox TaxID=43433 RepID=UPI00221F843B|nr:uncharacterized protein BZA05DRAFT_388718 [Tricharina praecox]KAI5856495.1 hypothetical protein BZA05DRAFT_388718 [Tricharina praecox]